MNPQLLTVTKKKQKSAEVEVLKLKIYLKSLWLRIPSKTFDSGKPRSISFTDDQVSELYDMATRGEK